MAGCPDDNTLQAFLDGRLSPARSKELHLHIDTCRACRDVLGLMASLGPPPPAGPGPLTFAPDEVVAGRYRIVRFLARGGMGQVYLARDQELGIDVALKALLPHISDNQRALARFKRGDVLLARKVSHENVCRIFDLGVYQRTGPSGQETIHFVTMELLAGDTLAQRLRESGPLDPAEALPLVRQMVLALDAAHQQGIVHRDFKPDNIFLVPAGKDGERVVVTDFGMALAPLAQQGEASLTGEGAMVGTPAYMSPEQVEGEDVGPAADIYALGVVLYEMVTAKRPFVADTPQGVALKRVKEVPPSPRSHRPDLDPRWEAVILRCLERDPSARYRSTRDVLRALSGPAGPDGTDRPEMARTQDAAAPPTPPAGGKRRRWAFAAAVLGVAGVVAGVVWHRVHHLPARVLIPGGTFRMGSTDSEIGAAFWWCKSLAAGANADCLMARYEREQPVRQVRVSPFYLDVIEVTNERLAAWLNRLSGLRVDSERWVRQGPVLLLDLYPLYGPSYGLRYRSGRYEVLEGEQRKPVTQITWDGALRYCQAQGGRLPTEAEWELAARGPDGRNFPWGHKEPSCTDMVFGRGKGEVCEHLGEGPAEAGRTSGDRTPEGVFDLGGNVQEWVMDRFEERYRPCQPLCVDPLVDDLSAGASAPGGPILRVVRGGAWSQLAVVCRSAGRNKWQQDKAAINIGFRCAWPASR